MRSSRATRVIRSLGWISIAAMSIALVNRLWRSETVPALIGMQGVTQWLVVPAYPLAVAAAMSRKWAMFTCAGALCVAQVALSVASYGSKGSQPAAPGDVRIRLVTANVLLTNDRIVELANELASLDADVVLLQEVTPEVLEAIKCSELWTSFPYSEVAPAPQFHGAATFSKFPIVAMGGPGTGGLATRGLINIGDVTDGGAGMLMTDLLTPGGTIRVLNVHTVAPLTRSDAAIWRVQLNGLEAFRAESEYPVVLAGDFNATLDHAPFESLLGAQLHDAFTVAGTGFGFTWPRWDGPVPPVMRLDHVLVSDGITVLSIDEHTSVGSDHLRLHVELALGSR